MKKNLFLAVVLSWAITGSAFAGPLLPDSGIKSPLAVTQRGTYSVLTDFSVASEKSCGTTGALPVPGNYLSGVTAHYAAWSPSFGLWHFCADAATVVRSWGLPGDIPVPEDYNGDGLSDLAVYRPATGEWFVQVNSGGFSSGAVTVTQFGLPGDVPVPGRYDADALSDLAVFRGDAFSGGAYWFIKHSTDNSEEQAAFGLLGDFPVPEDYDGDGRTQVAVWRPSDGAWYVLEADGVTITRTQFGLRGDIPSPADADGDGKADLIVYRPTLAQWFVKGSSDGQLRQVTFGEIGARVANHSRAVVLDRRAALDFNGDRLTDLVVVRKNTDNTLRFLFSTGTTQPHPYSSIQFGLAGNTVANGDYDGDGKSDLTVVETEEGYLLWHFLRSAEQQQRRTELIVTYGLEGDQVLPADYDGDKIADLCVVRNMPDGLKLWLPNASGIMAIAPVSWGFTSDTALTADIDGDGRSDYIVVRQSSGQLLWLVRTAGGNALAPRLFGLVGDELTAGDYNGDGKAEIGVTRRVSGAKMVIIDGLAPYYWGLTSDTSLAGHYAGDGTVSSAIFRVVNGQGFFYVRNSLSGALAIPFGVVGDVPVAALGATGTESSTGGGGSTTGQRVNCATRSSATAQEQGFLWNPAYTDGKLLVRFGSVYAGTIQRVGLVESQTTGDVVLETLSSAGTGADGRPSYRGTKAGSGYPLGVILIRQSLDGTNNCIDIPNPGLQYGTS
jgi:hypothetical protein